MVSMNSSSPHEHVALTPERDARSAALPAPTLANVPYGGHERQVLDFWKADSPGPTPVLFYIHGGGWLSNDKSLIELENGIDAFLEAGISVVSINYRYVKQTILTEDATPEAAITPSAADEEGPPVKAPLEDAARALQFVRSRAAEWNVDKERVCVSGSSAGACSCLWLAFHPDRADPTSPDPVARESTRVWCAALRSAQTTLDPKEMREWTPNSRYGGHAFGFAWNPKDPDEVFRNFLANREAVLPWILEYSPYALVTENAPPIYLAYKSAPALGKEQEDPTHTANFGVKLAQKLAGLGRECELVYPGAADVRHPGILDFLLAQEAPDVVRAGL